MTHNSFLVKGIERFSRSAAYRRRFLWKKTQHKTRRTAPKVVAKAKAPKVPKVKPFGKETRTIKTSKGPGYYPEEPVRHRLHSRKRKHNPTRLRHSIKPGTVLILVSGRFRGHRVVFLRQLRTGLLLVTGPFKINGIPLRRVNQAYVIATSTRVDLTGIKIDKKFNDNYFRAPRKAAAAAGADAAGKKDAAVSAAEGEKKAGEDKDKKKTKKDFFASRKKKEGLPASKAADQKALDALLLPRIKQVPLLRQYLRETFTLRKGQYPHQMKF